MARVAAGGPVCENATAMGSSLVYWLALSLPLGAVVYLWLRGRGLSAKISGLSTELDRRTTALQEAHQTLNRLAGVDAVTSLANHSSFQQFLRGEWRRALREASTLSVLMIDIDHFSEFNDQLGHQAGDDCLVKIGRAITEIVRRPGDLVARYGGEQFGVVLSRTCPKGAFRVAHRICAGVEGLAIPHPESGVSPCVTVSVGVATSTPAVDSKWEELELVAGANQAVADAKNSGRNRVIAHEAGQPATDETSVGS